MNRAHPEIIVFVGLQASGKSTFYRRFLRGTHALVSKDQMGNARDKESRQSRMLSEFLAERISVVVDNTNPTKETRLTLIQAGRSAGFRVVCIYFDSTLGDCLHRNSRRIGKERIPDKGVVATFKLLVPPTHDEGFDEILIVRMQADGDFSIAEMERRKASPDEEG